MKKMLFHLIDGKITKENKILPLNNIEEFKINFYTQEIKMYKEWFEKIHSKVHFFATIFYRLSISNIAIANIYRILYLDSYQIII